MIISVFDRVENNVGKGENAGYQHFLLFPQCFQKVSFPEASKGVSGLKLPGTIIFCLHSACFFYSFLFLLANSVCTNNRESFLPNDKI